MVRVMSIDWGQIVAAAIPAVFALILFWLGMPKQRSDMLRGVVESQDELITQLQKELNREREGREELRDELERQSKKVATQQVELDLLRASVHALNGRLEENERKLVAVTKENSILRDKIGELTGVRPDTGPLRG